MKTASHYRYTCLIFLGAGASFASAFVPKKASSSSKHPKIPTSSAAGAPVSTISTGICLNLLPIPHEDADLATPPMATFEVLSRSASATSSSTTSTTSSTSAFQTNQREMWNRVAKDTATTLWLASDASLEGETTMGTNKGNFFASLDSVETLNGATKDRSVLLAKMIDEIKVVPVGQKESVSTDPFSPVPTFSYENPGATQTFLAKDSKGERPVAVGTWKVIYAPHMTTAMDLFRGRFDVTYDLFEDGTMVSHAYYDFPIVGRGYLSVSGTYGSLSNDASLRYSRVDFDKAWVKAGNNPSEPYASLEDVPDSFLKTVINEVGKRAFIESVAVFPVSFLDDDTIVFEFESLGTKVCAHKQVSA